jgi:hypothetical protein
LNKWHFVVGSYDGKIIKLYIDGRVQSQTKVNGTMSKHDSKLFIGKHENASQVPPIDIDEIKIYSRALKQSEVDELNCQRLLNFSAGEDFSVCLGDSITLKCEGVCSSVVWNNGVTDNIAFIPESTATYVVKGNSEYGCAAQDTIVVEVNPLPTVNAGDDITINQGESVNLTASGDASTYTWDKGVVDGVSFVPISTDTFTVTGTSFDGCVATDQVTITVNSTGIEDVLGVFNVFPNPVVDILHIQCQSEIKSVKVYDITGNLVKSLENSEINGVVSFKGLPQGIYVVKVFIGTKTATYKIYRR